MKKENLILVLMVRKRAYRQDYLLPKGSSQHMRGLVQGFTSVDPLASQSPHLNPYHYSSNNPINRVDPTGMKDGKASAPAPESKGNNLNGSKVLDSQLTTGGENTTKSNEIVYDGGMLNEVVISGEKITGIEPLPSRTVDSDATRVDGSLLMDRSNLSNEVSDFRKGLASFLRNTKNFSPTQANPFYMAEAITYDYGWGLVGAEGDAGEYFILAGDHAGQTIPFTEIAGGVAPEGGVGVEIGRVDVEGDLSKFNPEKDLFGPREKYWGGVGEGISAGGAYSYGYTNEDRRKVETKSLQVGIGLSALIISGGYNTGEIKTLKNGR